MGSPGAKNKSCIYEMETFHMTHDFGDLLGQWLFVQNLPSVNLGFRHHHILVTPADGLLCHSFLWLSSFCQTSHNPFSGCVHLTSRCLLPIFLYFKYYISISFQTNEDMIHHWIFISLSTSRDALSCKTQHFYCMNPIMCIIYLICHIFVGL